MEETNKPDMDNLDPHDQPNERREEASSMFRSRTDLSHVKEMIDKIRAEVGKIIVGQEQMVDLLIAALLADGHVLIEGLPGLAKTLTAKILAKTVDTDFSRIQFTPDLMPSDVLGTSVFNFKSSEFEFKAGPIFSNIVLIDEINRAPAKTQAALFEVMEEKQVSIDGQTYKMETPFMIVATQNPIDMEGTYRLPEAQMDRFLFKVNVDYPNLEDEISIINGFHKMNNKNDLSQIKPILSAESIKTNRDLVNQIHVGDNLIRFIAQLVQRTRKNNNILIGASPRASLGLLKAAKAMAVIRGRDFVTPEDIIDLAEPILNHRIVLTPEKEMEGDNTGKLIKQIIQSLEVPR
jgi:MoxR-like ATPase